MKFATAFAALAVTATVSATTVVDTNAHRLARGLPPKAPLRRATPASRARRGKPSGTPSSSGQCSTGSQHCCDSTATAGSPQASGLLGSLGINILSDVLVGLTCSPLEGLGLGVNGCTQQPVCCNNDTFNGVVVIGCTPINLNL